MNYAVFSEGGYYLYYALCSIFRCRIIFIVCTAEYFWGVYTIYTMHYKVFLGVDTNYTMHYTVFSEGGYYLYYALCSIFRGRIIFILCTTQYSSWVDTIYTMHYAVFSRVDTIYNMHYTEFSGVDTIYTMHYTVFSRVDTIYTMLYAVFSRVDTIFTMH